MDVSMVKMAQPNLTNVNVIKVHIDTICIQMLLMNVQTNYMYVSTCIC